MQPGLYHTLFLLLVLVLVCLQLCIDAVITLMRLRPLMFQVMRGKSKAEIKKLMGVSDKIADLNLERFKSFKSSAEAKGTSPEAAGDNFRPAVSAVDPELV